MGRTILIWTERIIAAASHLGSYIMIPALIAVSIYDIVGRQFFDTGSTRLQVALLFCYGHAGLGIHLLARPACADRSDQ